MDIACDLLYKKRELEYAFVWLDFIQRNTGRVNKTIEGVTQKIPDRGKCWASLTSSPSSLLSSHASRLIASAVLRIDIKGILFAA